MVLTEGETIFLKSSASALYRLTFLPSDCIYIFFFNLFLLSLPLDVHPNRDNRATAAATADAFPNIPG